MSSVGYGEPQTIYGLINENTGFEIIFISYISRRLIITISSLYVLGTYLNTKPNKAINSFYKKFVVDVVITTFSKLYQHVSLKQALLRFNVFL